MPNLYYVVSDYFATGEGHTLSILITRLQARDEDYAEIPRYDLEKGVYHPGVLAKSPEEIVLRQFAEAFDSWWAQGAVIMEREEFIRRYRPYIPDYIVKLTSDVSGSFSYCAQVHLNFS